MFRIFALIFMILFVAANANAARHNLSMPKVNIPTSDEKIMEKAQDLESVLISVMMEPMFPSGEDSDVFGGGKGSSVYRTLMLQEYGKIIAQSGGVGLAPSIARTIK